MEPLTLGLISTAIINAVWSLVNLAIHNRLIAEWDAVHTARDMVADLLERLKAEGKGAAP